MMKLIKNPVIEIANKSTRKFLLTAAMSTATFIAATMANAANETTIALDLANANTSKHEIAVLQVLSEICPPLLGSKKSINFRQSYNTELRKMLPATIENPAAALQYLSTQQDYKTVLASMRDWTMGFSREENLALCNDLANAKI